MKKIVSLAGAVFLGMMMLSTPAQAATHPLRIVALGDSYASGVGAGNYIGGTAGNCWQSLNSPAQQVTRALIAKGHEVELTNATCSGDKIADVRTYQLGALQKDTNAVIMAVGGNDAGFGPLVGLCLTSVCSGGPIKAAKAALPAMGVNLVRLLSEIHSRSPRAKIVLTGYGQPMTTEANGAGAADPICAAQYFDLKERKEGGEFSAALDFTLRLATGVAQLRGINVTFVSPYQFSFGQTGTLRPEFAGHSLCSSMQQLYRGFDALAPPPGGDPAGQTAVMHMNAGGYQALAALVLGKL